MKAIQFPHPLVSAMLDATEMERRLIGVLYDARPHRLVMWKVMIAIGVKPDREKCGREEYKFQACLAFALLRIRVAKILSRHGWVIHRSGGTVDHEIWIEQLRSS